MQATVLKCEHCGKTFERGSSRKAIHCSLSCAQKARAEREGRTLDRTCIGCGAIFKKKKGRNAGKYCSRDCYAQVIKTNARQPEPKPIIACAVCEREFEQMLSTQKMCSDECRKKHARAMSKEAYSNTPPRTYTCLVCSSEFVRSGRHGGNARYCSNRCANKAEKKKRRAYDRNLERMRSRVIRAGERLNPYDVFTRDGWKCQLCGKPVKRGAQVPDSLAPVLDHITPISNGGEHIMKNVQCAHFLCNSKRSNVGSAQMRLFG